MIQPPVQNDKDLAEALLEIAPKLLRKLGADVPLENTSSATNPAWKDVIELRATPGQLTLLSVLLEHGQCTMQELAEHLAVAPSTATAMVKRLLSQGYIERTHDTIDWRTVWVKPTEAGCRAVAIFHRARLASLQHRLAQLSNDEREHITSALIALFHLIEL